MPAFSLGNSLDVRGFRPQAHQYHTQENEKSKDLNEKWEIASINSTFEYNNRILNRKMENLGNIFELLRQKKTAAFCGAGISRKSGIPTANIFIDQIVKSIFIDEKVHSKVMEQYLVKKVPFERFIQKILDTTQEDGIFDILKYETCSYVHHSISNLCKHRYLREIYTTNFDTLIEKSLKDKSFEHQVTKYYLEKHFVKVGRMSKSMNLPLIKLHGTIENKESIRNTIDKISKLEHYKPRVNAIKYIFNDSDMDVLLILGYSFSDHFDINTVLRNLKTNKVIILINHCEGVKDPTIKSISCLNSNFGFDFKNYFGYTVSIDTSYFLSEMQKYLNILDGKIELAINFESRRNWKRIVEKWVTRVPSIAFIRLKTELLLLVGINEEKTIFPLINMLNKYHNRINTVLEIDGKLQKATLLRQKLNPKSIEKARVMANSCLKDSIKLKYLKGIGKSNHLLGLIYAHDLRMDQDANKYFKSALLVYKKIDDHLNVSLEELQLASLKRRQGKIDEAIEMYDNVRKYREKVGDLTGASKSFQGLGNSYLHKYFQDNNKTYLSLAKKYYKKYHDLTSTLGDNWQISTSNLSMAEVYFLLGDRVNAEKHSNASIELRSHDKNKEYWNSMFLKAQIDFKFAKNKSERISAIKLMDKILDERKHLKALEEIHESQITIYLCKLEIEPSVKLLQGMKKYISKHKNKIANHSKCAIRNEIAKINTSNKFEDNNTLTQILTLLD